MQPSSRLLAIRRWARPALSGLLGVIAILAIVSWLRSYWYADSAVLSLRSSEHIAVYSTSGRVFTSLEYKSAKRGVDWTSNRIVLAPATDDIDRVPILRIAYLPAATRLYLAHWLVAAVSGCLALAPWIPHRFSLRGLMLTISLLALVVGLILWIERTF